MEKSGIQERIKRYLDSNKEVGLGVLLQNCLHTGGSFIDGIYVLDEMVKTGRVNCAERDDGFFYSVVKPASKKRG